MGNLTESMCGYVEPCSDLDPLPCADLVIRPIPEAEVRAEELTCSRVLHAAPVWLHVYRFNSASIWSGALGAYHTGVEVCGREYYFDADASPRTHFDCGIYTCTPATAQIGDAVHEHRIRLGTISLSEKQLSAVIAELGEEWLHGSYHVFSRNCNHFVESLCAALNVEPPPYWTNNLARCFRPLVPSRLYNYVARKSGIHTEWVSEEMADTCYCCDEGFTMFKRQNHCRYCGGAFCRDCVKISETRLPLFEFPDLVCAQCEVLMRSRRAVAAKRRKMRAVDGESCATGPDYSYVYQDALITQAQADILGNRCNCGDC
eukprot:TRINITY_DN7311_c1_g1_i1.p1 TRINITY_DN7311_c1_g1~~TRINITY_DN7311_c1_g1_i1.p1  ORF type:complete len:317 (+),score=18.47 TRINITY_DN7311_c1_g1_i1:165-1115(+)